MIKSRFYLMTITLLACLMSLGACGDMRGPSLGGTPGSMSADTLCYREAVRSTPEMRAEIERRNLDCHALLQDDPLLVDQRY